MVIGIANIIPGLSGSTLAVIMGIYEKFINIFTKFDLIFIKLIFDFEIKKLKKHISFQFLISIFTGVIISFILMALLLKDLLNKYETHTYAYFFGIILTSIFYISKYTSSWKKKEILFFIIGFVTSLIIVIFATDFNLQENTNFFFVLFCGMVGVIGMLIPGLSGSYLLIILGNYELLLSETIYYLTHPSDEFYFYLKLFLFFLIGNVVGILLFSRIIKWVLKNYKNLTFATLTGFITGSLPLLWPFKKNILHNFQANTDLYIFLIISIGMLTMFFIEKIAEKYKNV